MPKNNNLTPTKLPMEIRFGEEPTTTFKNNLQSIDVELVSAPTMDELRSYLPQFITATWQEVGDKYYDNNISTKEKDEIIRDAMFGRALPTALETINLVFRISGISLQEVTHIIRYRQAAFSADCSGDKWWTHKDALVPNSIENSSKFYERYKKIVEDAKQLYCDMIDTEQISIMDARYILPRCLDTFYYMRMNLKDAIYFIKQRIDKQIQPETDNIIAYQMYCAILEQYPVANGLIDIHQPSYFYMKMARTGKATNLYFPDADSDEFEWNEDDFIYQCYRDEMNGTDDGSFNLFNGMLRYYEAKIKNIEKLNEAKLEKEYEE
jgi:thymidylate synthase (FAD)